MFQVEEGEASSKAVAAVVVAVRLGVGAASMTRQELLRQGQQGLLAAVPSGPHSTADSMRHICGYPHVSLHVLENPTSRDTTYAA